jgi:hypothetical protein
MEWRCLSVVPWFLPAIGTSLAATASRGLMESAGRFDRASDDRQEVGERSRSRSPAPPDTLPDAGPPADVRPGDWSCPKCAANVFASKYSCFKCGEPKPGVGTPPVPVGDNVRPGDWVCGSCGANVFASKSACFRCGAPKPMPGGYGGYPGGGGMGGYGGGPPPQQGGGEVRPGDWACGSCGANVFSTKTSCFRCGPRPHYRLRPHPWAKSAASPVADPVANPVSNPVVKSVADPVANPVLIL